MQGYRPEMEDAHHVELSLSEKYPDVTFVGASSVHLIRSVLAVRALRSRSRKGEVATRALLSAAGDKGRSEPCSDRVYDGHSGDLVSNRLAEGLHIAIGELPDLSDESLVEAVVSFDQVATPFCAPSA